MRFKYQGFLIKHALPLIIFNIARLPQLISLRDWRLKGQILSDGHDQLASLGCRLLQLLGRCAGMVQPNFMRALHHSFDVVSFTDAYEV